MNYMVTKRNGSAVNDFDRIFDSFFNRGEVQSATRVPAVDIVESEKGYEIMAELPGFSEDELDIKVKDNLLTISAQRLEQSEKKESVEKAEKNYLKRERASHSFKRSFYLPKDASAESIEAVFNQGLLSLNIGKKEEAKPLSIKVNTK